MERQLQEKRYTEKETKTEWENTWYASGISCLLFRERQDAGQTGRRNRQYKTRTVQDTDRARHKRYKTRTVQDTHGTRHSSEMPESYYFLSARRLQPVSSICLLGPFALFALFQCFLYFEICSHVRVHNWLKTSGRVTTGPVAEIRQGSAGQPAELPLPFVCRNHSDKCWTACGTATPSQWFLLSRHSANSQKAARVLHNSNSAVTTLGKIHTNTCGERKNELLLHSNASW